MATVIACAYDEQSTTDTLVNYYAQGVAYKMMADYLAGIAAYSGIQTLLAMAIGELENGGPGNNWM